MNGHLRDRAIKFFPSDHTYVVHPGTSSAATFPLSVTDVWNRYFTPFDAGAILDTYYRTWMQKGSHKYYDFISACRKDGLTDDDTKEALRTRWEREAVEASAKGTEMHRNIEFALGGQQYDGSSREMQMFHSFVYNELLERKWRVYRLEWSIYCTEAMVAGQVDAIFVDPSLKFHMVDWKRSKHELHAAANSQFNRVGKEPFQELWDSAFGHYAVQQNLYAVILKRRYRLEMESMWLVRLHPDNKSSSYEITDVPDLKDAAGKVLNDIAAKRPRNLPWECAT